MLTETPGDGSSAKHVATYYTLLQAAYGRLRLKVRFSNKKTYLGLRPKYVFSSAAGRKYGNVLTKYEKKTYGPLYSMCLRGQL